MPVEPPVTPLRDFPFPAYPNGWFGVAWSDEVAAGALRTVRAFGRDLVLWRDEPGAAHVFDAHCPHLGAHLGYGGAVVDGAVRCPFHHWRFDGAGRCVEIPYAKRIPARARIRSWDVCERNGLVFVWHHAEGEPPGDEIEPIPEYGAKGWGEPIRKRWAVKSRLYDMGENPVDAQHFRYLHGGIAPRFEQVPDGRGGKKNVAELEMPTPRGPIEGSITSEYQGAGFGVVHVRGVLHTVIMMANSPIDEDTVDVKFAYLQPSTDDPKVARLGEKMVGELVRQMEQDIVIFEHKRYLTRPCLLPEDGPIAEYRRVARKDYSGTFFEED